MRILSILYRKRRSIVSLGLYYYSLSYYSKGIRVSKANL